MLVKMVFKWVQQHNKLLNIYSDSCDILPGGKCHTPMLVNMVFRWVPQHNKLLNICCDNYILPAGKCHTMLDLDGGGQEQEVTICLDIFIP